MNDDSSITSNIPLTAPECYYDTGRKSYWVKDDDDIWIEVNGSDALKEFYASGYSKKKMVKGMTEAEDGLRQVRMSRNIVFAGPVAGNDAGMKESETGKYLVTRGMSLPNPVEGSWETIAKLGLRLFGPDQWEYVLGWSSNAVRTLHNKEPRWGQLLALAGPASCGKSFWQNRVVTPLLGGRTARPLQYMMGQTSFNEDIIQAEHLLLEDESVKTDHKGRQAFGAHIKSFTVNNSQRFHPKGRSAYVMVTKHFMTLSVNDEPHNLAILPPLDESITDKIMLIKCLAAITDEWPGKGNLAEFEKQIAAEIGAFTHYLLKVHKIVENKQHIRFGISAFQNVDLVEAINGLSAAAELDYLIDACYANDDQRLKGKCIRKSASEIQSDLERHPDTSRRAANMLRWQSACGTYLAELSRQMSKKYIGGSIHARPRIWTIMWS